MSARLARLKTQYADTIGLDHVRGSSHSGVGGIVIFCNLSDAGISTSSFPSKGAAACDVSWLLAFEAQPFLSSVFSFFFRKWLCLGGIDVCRLRSSSGVGLAPTSSR